MKHCLVSGRAVSTIERSNEEQRRAKSKRNKRKSDGEYVVVSKQDDV